MRWRGRSSRNGERCARRDSFVCVAARVSWRVRVFVSVCASVGSPGRAVDQPASHERGENTKTASDSRAGGRAGARARVIYGCIITDRLEDENNF